MDDDDPADADASPGVWGGTLTDEADPPPPEHATAPHANTTARICAWACLMFWSESISSEKGLIYQRFR